MTWNERIKVLSAFINIFVTERFPKNEDIISAYKKNNIFMWFS